MPDQVRTRFAPSPTGFLHVGGLRTALFNYLFARHHDGKFILRIEDTDQTRYVENAVEKLISSLQWAGLDYDEGPQVGGEAGPYIQSQRADIYRNYVQQLIDEGQAYYCFCTPEELEAMREKHIAKGLTPQYDGTCRHRSEAEVKQKLEESLPHVVRLKMPREGETTFEDLIRGSVSFQNELIDDQILLKSDGYPTYHLANVVDDHLMGITHVIRGEEWLPSVPKHLKIYQALGWQPPQMAHLSLLLNPDRSKLSKRQGDVAVEDYIEKGYLPQTLVNFVALLGWNPGTDEELFSLEELIEEFSLERVNKAGAVFDIEKLNWMNGHFLRELPENELVDFLTPFLEKAGADVSNAEKTRKVILAVYKRINTGQEVFHRARIFYQDSIEVEEAEALEILKKDTTQVVLEGFLQKLKDVDQLNMDNFRQLMKEVQKETGIKGPDLWKPIRVALTGETSGPELPVVIDIFGKEKVQDFIRQVLDKYVG